MAAIDVGSDAINRASTYTATYTDILMTNPANASGTITTVETWFATNATLWEVASFYLVSGTNYSTRDTESIGNVTSGSLQTFNGLTLEIATGDFIGSYWATGTIEASTSGASGIREIAGDKIPCTNQGFVLVDSDATESLYGTGSTPAVVAAFGSVATAILVGR